MDGNFSIGMMAAIGAGTGLLAFIVIAFWRWINERDPENEPPMICPNCGTFGHTKTVMPGSAAMAVFLLLVFVLPGIFYALWRQLNVRRECPTCGQTGMVPHDSPRGIQLQNQFHTLQS